MAERDWLTPQEVADHFKVTTNAVRKWVDSGLLRAELSVGGHRRIDPASVKELDRLKDIRSLKDRRSAYAALRKHNLGEEAVPPES